MARHPLTTRLRELGYCLTLYGWRWARQIVFCLGLGVGVGVGLVWLWWAFSLD